MTNHSCAKHPPSPHNLGIVFLPTLSIQIHHENENDNENTFRKVFLYEIEILPWHDGIQIRIEGLRMLEPSRHPFVCSKKVCNNKL